MEVEVESKNPKGEEPAYLNQKEENNPEKEKPEEDQGQLEEKNEVEEQKEEENHKEDLQKMEEEKEKEKEEHKNDLNDEKESMELYLKKKLEKISPTIYIEYPKSEDISPLSKLDSENIKSFLEKFGKITFIEIYHLIALIQFETFLSAYSCIKYFEKININKKEKVICRWFEEKDEEIITNDIISRIRKLKPYEIVENINKSMKNYYLRKKEKNSNFSYIQEDEENNIKENILTDGITQMEYYSIFSLTPKAQKEFNEMVILNTNRGFQNLELSNIQNNKDINVNSSQVNTINEKGNTNIKYICKFYLQIEADREFQIVKRIIGAKGSNLKRIIDYCSKGPGGVYIPDAIKLKLKGAGSGYREREGDKNEPLYLCVISKYPDKYKKACSFVIELIINIYGEYKRFCERKGKKPISNLNIQKAEYISTRGY